MLQKIVYLNMSWIRIQYEESRVVTRTSCAIQTQDVKVNVNPGLKKLK